MVRSRRTCDWPSQVDNNSLADWRQVERNSAHAASASRRSRSLLGAPDTMRSTNRPKRTGDNTPSAVLDSSMVTAKQICHLSFDTKHNMRRRVPAAMSTGSPAKSFIS